MDHEDEYEAFLRECEEDIRFSEAVRAAFRRDVAQLQRLREARHARELEEVRSRRRQERLALRRGLTTLAGHATLALLLVAVLLVTVHALGWWR